MMKSDEVVHPAPWEPRELHLGPADNCWACGTWTEASPPILSPGPPAEVVDQVLEEILEADRPPSIFWSAVIFLVVLAFVVWDLWP